jgi:hypothetical protein
VVLEIQISLKHGFEGFYPHLHSGVAAPHTGLKKHFLAGFEELSVTLSVRTSRTNPPPHSLS